jgi:hypothetical protein
MKFNIPEKAIKERDGAHYNLACYLKDTDYVARRAFKGVKFMFRADILDLSANHSDLNDDHIALSVVDPSLVEHKQDMEPIIIRPAALDGSVRAARVVKKHANQRFVETDTLGRVFVGEKGHQIRVNQIINVKDGVLFLAKVATLPNH